MATVNLNDYEKCKNGKNKPYKETLWEVSYLEYNQGKRNAKSLLFTSQDDAEFMFNDIKTKIEELTEDCTVIKQVEKKHKIHGNLLKKCYVYSISNECRHTIGITLKFVKVY